MLLRVCVDAQSGGEALGQEKAELLTQLSVTWHFQRVSTPSVHNHWHWHWPCCTLESVSKRSCVTLQSLTVCVCDLTYLACSICMWCENVGLWHLNMWNNIWRASTHCKALLQLYDWTGTQTSQSCETVPPHSCHFLGQRHTQRLISSVCALCPSVHSQCKGSGNGGRHVDTSPLERRCLSLSAPDLVQSLRLFFQTRLPRTEAEGERGQAPERTGMKGWRTKGSRGVGVRIPLSDPAHAF